MDHDDKTAPARRGLPVRSTAPAGTPYPVAPPSPAPAAPAVVAAAAPPKPPPPTASQPRTVGGHTARLNVPENVPEDDALAFERPSSSAPIVVHDGPPVSPPAPRSAGGTVRLATLSPDEAQPAAAPKAEAPPTSAKSAPKPVSSDGGATPPVDVGGGAPRPPAPPPPAAARASVKDDGSSFLALLFAPVSVAVGLIFFAMGSMIGLTLSGRLIQFSISAAPVRTTAPTAPPTPPTAPPTVTGAISAVAPGPTATATTSANPGPSTRPSAVRPPAHTSKLPPLPFP